MNIFYLHKVKMRHFWKKFLVSFKYQNCLDATKDMITKGEIDPNWSLVTLSLDATQNLIN